MLFGKHNTISKPSLATKENVVSTQRNNGEVQLSRRRDEEGNACSRGTHSPQEAVEAAGHSLWFTD